MVIRGVHTSSTVTQAQRDLVGTTALVIYYNNHFVTDCVPLALLVYAEETRRGDEEKVSSPSEGTPSDRTGGGDGRGSVRQSYPVLFRVRTFDNGFGLLVGRMYSSPSKTLRHWLAFFCPFSPTMFCILRPFCRRVQEFLSSKNDCSLFVLGTHNKKRPHNLVLGRRALHAHLAEDDLFAPFPVQEERTTTSYWIWLN